MSKNWKSPMHNRPLKARLLFTALCLVCFAEALQAQSVLYNLTGDHPNDRFGAAVGSAGDVNGDGFPDIIVGIPWDATFHANSGAARVFSGKDASILYTFYSPQPSIYNFGYIVAGAGDVNNDGYADLIIGCENSFDQKAFVFSGKDGSVLYTFSGGAYDFFGVSVAAAGDINGDGFDDLIVGAPQTERFHQGVGYARVYSGKDGSIIYQWNGCGILDGFGGSVGGAGDVNADGYADLIVYSGRTMGAGCPSSVKVFSGRDGSLLYSIPIDTEISSGPKTVGGAGDVNGDGYADFIVGEIPDSSCNGGNIPSHVTVFSGRDGSVLHDFGGPPGCTRFGWSVANAGDLDGDGYTDCIVGAAQANYAEVYSGRTGGLLYHVAANLNDFGWDVQGLGDLNGDGYAEFIVGAFSDDHAIVYTTRPASPFTPFCFGDGSIASCPCSNSGSVGHGCGNSAGTGGAIVTMTGIAGLLADTVQFMSSGELPSALSVLLQGSATIASVNFGDGLRCAGGALKRLYTKSATSGVMKAPQSGDPSVSARSATLGDQIPLGAMRVYQVYYRDPSLGFCPGGFNVSSAVAVTWER